MEWVLCEYQQSREWLHKVVEVVVLCWLDDRTRRSGASDAAEAWEDSWRSRVNCSGAALCQLRWRQ
jgi:hypothetical protein